MPRSQRGRHPQLEVAGGDVAHTPVLQRRDAFRARPASRTAPVAIRVDGVTAPIGGHVLDLSAGGMLVALPRTARSSVPAIAPGAPGVAYLAFLDPSQAWERSAEAYEGVPAVSARVLRREHANARSELRVALAFEQPAACLRARLARYVQDCDRETLRLRRALSARR